MRPLFLLLAIVACSSKPDRVVGRWQGEGGKGRIFELRADGSLDMDPVSDDRCGDDKPGLDACRAKQRWSRSGSTVTIRRGAFASRVQSMLVAKPGACACTLESYELAFDADTLTIGKERAVRVR